MCALVFFVNKQTNKQTIKTSPDRSCSPRYHTQTEQSGISSTLSLLSQLHSSSRYTASVTSSGRERENPRWTLITTSHTTSVWRLKTPLAAAETAQPICLYLAVLFQKVELMRRLIHTPITPLFYVPLTGRYKGGVCACFLRK